MIEQTWLLWLIGAACASALMVVMWVIAVRIENASQVDVACAVTAVTVPYGWIAIAVPAFLLVLLIRITGIPETEAQAVRSRGDDYRRYQREVSVFAPLPPRSRAT